MPPRSICGPGEEIRNNSNTSIVPASELISITVTNPNALPAGCHTLCNFNISPDLTQYLVFQMAEAYGLLSE
jgi:hypothetical protein